MKNNKWTRAVGGLLLLTLVTSGFVGGTLAKYVSKKDATSKARVAKWGITLTAPTLAEQGFDTMYGADTSESNILSKLEEVDGEKISVKSTYNSSFSNNLVAPGTSGTFKGIKIDADEPEVAYQVTTTAEVMLTGWYTDGDQDRPQDFYCPLQFTVCGTKINGLDYNDANLLARAIEDAIVADTTYSNFVKPAGTGHHTTDSQYAGRYSWEWPFENGKNSSGDIVQTDENDTALGQLLADNNQDNDPKISIKVTTTVTQIN